MSYVKDTVVVADRALQGADGTTWKELVIADSSATFEPGQFLMAAPVSGGAGWPSPLMIQEVNREGFVVYIHPDSPLFGLRQKDALTVWGPNGAAIPVTGSYKILTDAKGLILTAPFLRRYTDRCKGLYIVGSKEVPGIPGLTGLEPVYVRKPSAADLSVADAILATLPLETVAEWKKEASPADTAKTVLFVGAKVGCGMGACRGCCIHSGEASTGVVVCQEGPFLPMDAVDYQKDQNFLGHYV